MFEAAGTTGFEGWQQGRNKMGSSLRMSSLLLQGWLGLRQMCFRTWHHSNNIIPGASSASLCDSENMAQPCDGVQGVVLGPDGPGCI